MLIETDPEEEALDRIMWGIEEADLPTLFPQILKLPVGQIEEYMQIVIELLATAALSAIRPCMDRQMTAELLRAMRQRITNAICFSLAISETEEGGREVLELSERIVSLLLCRYRQTGKNTWLINMPIFLNDAV